jgi:hypothetical protein
LAESQLRAFITYAAPDRDAAIRIAEGLRDVGLDVRLADDATPGADIYSALVDEITSADVVLILLSKASERSEWLQREASFAVTKMVRDPRSRVVPVILDRKATIPPFLQRIAYADFSDARDVRAPAHELAQQLSESVYPDWPTAGGGVDEFVGDALRIERESLALEKARYEQRAAWSTRQLVGGLGLASAMFAVLVAIAVAVWASDSKAVAVVVSAVLAGVGGLALGLFIWRAAAR